MRSCHSVDLELTHSPAMKCGTRTSETAVAHVVRSSAIVTKCGGKRPYYFQVEFSAVPRQLKEGVALLSAGIIAFVMESRFLASRGMTRRTRMRQIKGRSGCGGGDRRRSRGRIAGAGFRMGGERPAFCRRRKALWRGPLVWG